MRFDPVCRSLLIPAAAIFSLSLAVPAMAQTGMIKGKVLDAQGTPIQGAQVVISAGEGMQRKHETKTNKKGEYIQIGLPPGAYRVTAQKDSLSQTFDARVRISQTAEVNFQLIPGQAGSMQMTKEEAAKLDALKKALDAGVAANQTGKYDEAIAHFTEALGLRPTCASCYFSIGFAYARKQEFDKAEEALKKAIELKPDSADAYNELATVYNNQKKFEQAAAASAEAAKLASGTATAGAGSPDILYNQGVILWNSGKIPEAKKNFEEVIRQNPNHADAHYQLGMANLNEGKMSEAVAAFEAYLKLAPEGQYAAQAKSIVAQLKK